MVPDTRVSVKASFVRLPEESKTFHGVKVRWKDKLRLRNMISLNTTQWWYSLAQDRSGKGWHDLCHAQMKNKMQQHIEKE